MIFSTPPGGIKLKVFDYILKPIDNDELGKALDKAVRQLEKERDAKRHSQEIYDEMRKQARDTHIIRKQLALMDVLSCSDPAYDIREIFESEDINFTGYIIILAALRNYKRPIDEILSDYTMRIAPVSDNEDIITTKIGSNIITLVMFKKRLPTITKQYGIKVYDRLAMACQDHDTKIAVVSGELYTDLPGLYDAYEKVMVIMQKAMIEEEDKKVYYTGEYRDFDDVDYSTIIRKTKDVCNALSDAGEAEVDRILEEYLSYCVTHSRNQIYFIKLALMDLTFSYIKKKENMKMLSQASELSELIENFSKGGDVQYEIGQISALLHKMKQEEVLYNAEGCSVLVKKALEYINTCPIHEITLANVAGHFNVSPSYLSRVIKKEKGDNFINIVQHVKIQQAKFLLDDPTIKIEDIAHRVGYGSYLGFLKAFKQIEGISPQSYRSGGSEADQ